MQSLKQAIAHQDSFSASLLLAQYFHQDCPSVAHYASVIDNWCVQARLSSDYAVADQNSLANLVRFFYRDLAFSHDQSDFFAIQNSLLDKVIEFRTGLPLSLGLVFQAIATRLGFQVQGINFPGRFLLRVDFADSQGTQDTQSVYLDPSNGKILSHKNIESLYCQMLGDLEQHKMPPEALLSASCQESVVRLLHNIKAAFIAAQDYQPALLAVELLIELCPDDPYERRDRGFLLHQLDCLQLAVADYQYFIRQCPKDPASPLLAAQVKQLAAEARAVFH